MSNAERDRQLYMDKVKSLKPGMDEILKSEKDILEEITEDNKDAPSSITKRFTLVEEMLNLTSYFIVMNAISQATLKKINEDALGEARKCLTKAFSYLEELVSGYVDVAFSDYEDKVSRLDHINPEKRYHLIRKMGLTILIFQNSFRSDSKWKWSFVEIEGRFAAVTKNLFDFKTININSDPSSQYYRITTMHLRLLKKLLGEAGDRYRERYETSSNHIDDFQDGLNFLKALRRVNIILGDSTDADTLKKKIDAWDAKLKSDLAKKEEAANNHAHG